MLEILPESPPAGAPGHTPNETTLFTIIASENPFRNCWYAIAPLNDLPLDRPYGIELFNTPLVVFHDRSKGTFHCILDRCRHRNASLSCGATSKDGNITCLYHGWQYDGEGRCVKIPSISNYRGSSKLKLEHFGTHVAARILWVFAGRPEDADVGKLPHLPWSDPSYTAYMFVRDTEFDWIIYNEHNIDRYHLNFSHPTTLKRIPVPVRPPVRVPNSGSSQDPQHFHYTQELRTHAGTPAEGRTWFYPPSIVVARQDVKEKDLVHGISFIVTPLAYGRCRVIFLLYRSKKLPVPTFMFHITFARVTEEDAILVRSQMKHLAGQNLAADEAFSNVAADTVVSDYRKWLRDSGGLFWQREVNQRVKDYRAAQARTLAPQSASIYARWEGNMHLVSRDAQHFRICRSCQGAYRKFRTARVASSGVAVLAAVASCLWRAAPEMTISLGALSLVAVMVAVLSDHLTRVLRGRRF